MTELRRTLVMFTVTLFTLAPAGDGDRWGQTFRFVLGRSGACVAGAGLVLGLATGCTTAGAREREFVRQNLAIVPLVESVGTSGNDAVLFAGGDVSATVAMGEGTVLRFGGLGYESFGRVPSLIRVQAAGRRSPLVVSCESSMEFAEIDRTGLFGHHFSPGLDNVSMAIRRRREVIEEFEFWPQCPQFWEVQQASGPRYRYCAHAAGATAEPPPRPCDQSLGSAK